MRYKIKKNLKILAFLLLSIQIGAFSLYAAENNTESKTKNVVNTQTKYLENDFYIIGYGDILRIQFVGLDELSGEFLVLRDGNIQLPLIGSKKIIGLTLDGAKKRIVEFYKNDLIGPEIYVTLVRSRPIRVSLIGEVQRPGSYTLNNNELSRVDSSSASGTSLSGYSTVVDAIQKSGGLTFDADITKVKLYRKLPGDDGGFKKVNLNLLDMIKTGNQTNNPILFDGDSIRIDKQTNQENYIENTPNNLTPEIIKIHVVGEVNLPGLYEVDFKTRISQAILIAGGPNTWRFKDKIELLRVKRNGSVEVKKISFNKKGNSKKIDNVSLRDGDIIRVKKNLFGKSTDALGTFLPPIRDMYSLYGVYKLIE